MRGRYRILLGMAAGVGKTYRMLQEGRQARDEGRDVVIGYLEPHDRPDTIALADGIEQVPRLHAEHGGLELNEMDLDAVIARAPELALVDELAHTNAAGMRNAKRFEDIEEILVAGFDFDIVVRHDRNHVLPGIGFIERNQHGFRAGRRLLVFGHCRGARSTCRPEA